MNVPVTPEGELTFEDGVSAPGQVRRDARGDGRARRHQQLPAAEQSLQRLQPDADPRADLGSDGLMFTKVLIANRGAIACRIIRTLRRLGVSSGRGLLRGRSPRAARRAGGRGGAARPAAGGGELSESATRSSKRRATTGAEAIHPGYGFLSENADFAEACERAGHRLPRADAGADARARPEAHGARDRRARRRAAAAGHRPAADDVDDALVEAERCGYPVMLKSTAGGGGIGMRVCRDRRRTRASTSTRSRGWAQRTSARPACSSNASSSRRGTSRCRSSATARAA